MLAAIDIPLCQDLQPLLYIDTLNLRFSEMSKYYLSIEHHKFYKQKLPEHDMKPFEQKSSVSCIVPVWWQSQILMCCCSPEGAGKEQDACLGLSVVPAFLSWSFPAICGACVTLHSGEGSSENTLKKCSWQPSFAKSSMQLIRDKLKIWVIHIFDGLEGQGCCFLTQILQMLTRPCWGSRAPALFTTISVLPCTAHLVHELVHSCLVHEPLANPSSELSRNCLCFLCSLAPAALLSEEVDAVSVLWIAAEIMLKISQAGMKEHHTAALCLSPCYLTVLISWEIWPFPTCKTFYHAYLPIQA